MTIIVFLIDTSASMYQRAYLGGRPTLLDVAKSAVETFVKVRQRSPESRGDRYMLLTFEDPPNNIKAGWKENLATFMNELKNLQCSTMTTMGVALKHAFDMLNLNRMQTGIDTYGQGRCPFYLEPSVIVVITDGGRLSSGNGVQIDFNLPMHSPIPGSELTREPFRWDQRLFALVLRLAGTPAVERDSGLVPNDASPIDVMCEVTGGRSYSITSHRMLMQCIDSLVQKVQSGVVINFEKIGPDPPDRSDNDVEDSDPKQQIAVNTTGSNNGPPPAWHNCRKLIYVPRSAQKGIAVGFWPIPESFWPELDAAALPPRSAHPNVKFTCTSQEPMVIENLPFDKYELEPSPLTQFILARKQPTTCWQVFVANSYKSSEVVHPFGYLKASTNLTCVNLFVMPYNYPVLLPLLEELIQVHYMKPTNEWRTQFQNYMRTMPAYYAGPLRRALTRMGIPGPLAQTLISDSAENSLSYLVFNYLKRLKSQAKTEFDKLCNDVLNKQANMPGKQATLPVPAESVAIKVTSVVKKDVLAHPQLKEKFASHREQFTDYINCVVGVDTGHVPSYQTFRNPFDIPRARLLDQVVRMRSNYLQCSPTQTKYMDEDMKHSIPISQMGNYQEYLKRQTPKLREIESTPVRQHMFGNPFKIDKRMMVDEADIDLVGGSSNSVGSTKGTKRTAQTDLTGGRLPNRRKPGPLSRNLTVRKPSSSSDCLTPPPSPIPMSPSPIPEDWPVTTPESPVNYSESSTNVSLLNGEETTNTDIPQPMEVMQSFPQIEPSIVTSYVPPSITDTYTSDTFSPVENIPAEKELETKQPVDSFAELILSLKTKVTYHKHNQTIKSQMFREIRIPGTGLKNIQAHINSIKGGIDVQIAIVKQVIHECHRFRLPSVAKQMESLLEDMLLEKNEDSVNNKMSVQSDNQKTNILIK